MKNALLRILRIYALLKQNVVNKIYALFRNFLRLQSTIRF